jgi:hypothetical protein
MGEPSVDVLRFCGVAKSGVPRDHERLSFAPPCASRRNITALYNDWVFISINSLHDCGSRRVIDGCGGRLSP